MLGRRASAVRRLLRRRGRSIPNNRTSIVSVAAVLAIVGVLVTLHPIQASTAIHPNDARSETASSRRYDRLYDQAILIAASDPTIGMLDFLQRGLVRAMVESELSHDVGSTVAPKPARHAPRRVAREPARAVTPPPPAFLGLSRWHVAGSTSWYGPGFYGNVTACGQRYTRNIIGVAHRTLPCGTLVQLSWHGITVVAPVIDRGPYGHSSNVFDLSAALACGKLRPKGEKDGCFTRFHVKWRVVERNR